MSLLEELIKPFRFLFQGKTKKKKSPRAAGPRKPKKPAVRKAAKRPVRRPAAKSSRKPARRKIVNKKITANKIKPKPVRNSVKKRVAKPGKAKKTPAKLPPKTKSSAVRPAVDKETYVGDITHYFAKIQVVVLKVAGASLLAGDAIHIKGATTDFKQKAASLQIESVDVKVAVKGKLVGLKVVSPARVGDKVYKVK